MREIQSHGYYTENYGESGFLVKIHNELKFRRQIKKAQSVTSEQLQKLRKLKSIH